MGAFANLAALHVALWRVDRWYRRAWYTWPASLALLICMWVSVQPQSVPPPWGVPSSRPAAPSQPPPFGNSKPVATLPADLLQRLSGAQPNRIKVQEVHAPGTPAKPADAAAAAPSARESAVLYEEDTHDPQGRRFAGTVTWRTDHTTGADGHPDDATIHADVEIPERNLRLVMIIARNRDASLPASHTIQLNFTSTAEIPGGGIANVPGVLMKVTEQNKGVPLAGLAVKVTINDFLAGLSNVDADRVRNIQLLKERAWVDIPLVYADQHRAILAIDKGDSGARVFSDVFAVWQQ